MAEGANGDHMLCTCLHSLLDSEGRISLCPIIVSGHNATTASTAIRIGFDSPHLPQIDSRDRLQKFPWFIVEAIFIVQTDIGTCPQLGSIFIDDKLCKMPSCMAGVVVR